LNTIFYKFLVFRNILMCVVLGFHRLVMISALFCNVTQRSLVVSYRTFRSNLLGPIFKDQAVQEFLVCSTL